MRLFTNAKNRATASSPTAPKSFVIENICGDHLSRIIGSGGGGVGGSTEALHSVRHLQDSGGSQTSPRASAPGLLYVSFAKTGAQTKISRKERPRMFEY